MIKPLASAKVKVTRARADKSAPYCNAHRREGARVPEQEGAGMQGCRGERMRGRRGQEGLLI